MTKLFPLLVCMFLAVFNLHAEKQTEIKIAVVLGLTGSAAAHADAIKNGLTLAQEELAASGVKVALKYEDDQTNPSKTVSTFRYLLS